MPTRATNRQNLRALNSHRSFVLILSRPTFFHLFSFLCCFLPETPFLPLLHLALSVHYLQNEPNQQKKNTPSLLLSTSHSYEPSPSPSLLFSVRSARTLLEKSNPTTRSRLSSEPSLPLLINLLPSLMDRTESACLIRRVFSRGVRGTVQETSVFSSRCWKGVP